MCKTKTTESKNHFFHQIINFFGGPLRVAEGLYCYLCTYFTPFSRLFIVNFEQVNANWQSGKFSWNLIDIIVAYIFCLYSRYLKKKTNVAFSCLLKQFLNNLESVYYILLSIYYFPFYLHIEATLCYGCFETPERVW